jgi:hypothetical protein
LKERHTSLESEVVIEEAVLHSDQGSYFRKEDPTLEAEVPPKGAICYGGNRILHLAVENDTATEARIIFEDAVFKVSLGIFANVEEAVIPSRVVPEY